MCQLVKCLYTLGPQLGNEAERQALAVAALSTEEARETPALGSFLPRWPPFPVTPIGEGVSVVGEKSQRSTGVWWCE